MGGEKTDWPGKLSDWNGFRRHDFQIDGINCILIEPEGAPADGKLWYWRARFFGAFPYPDLALLKQGWHVAHIDIEELYGSPESNRRFDLLYNFMHSPVEMCDLRDVEGAVKLLTESIAALKGDESFIPGID